MNINFIVMWILFATAIIMIVKKRRLIIQKITDKLDREREISVLRNNAYHEERKRLASIEGQAIAQQQSQQRTNPTSQAGSNLRGMVFNDGRQGKSALRDMIMPDAYRMPPSDIPIERSTIIEYQEDEPETIASQAQPIYIKKKGKFVKLKQRAIKKAKPKPQPQEFQAMKEMIMPQASPEQKAKLKKDFEEMSKRMGVK